MVKRKRLGKVKVNKLGLKDVVAKRQKAAARELKRTQRDLRVAKEELTAQRERKRNAPTPIEKRKDLGYEAVSAGMRVDVENRRAQKEKLRAERNLKKLQMSKSSMMGSSSSPAKTKTKKKIKGLSRTPGSTSTSSKTSASSKTASSASTKKRKILIGQHQEDLLDDAQVDEHEKTIGPEEEDGGFINLLEGLLLEDKRS